MKKIVISIVIGMMFIAVPLGVSASSSKLTTKSLQDQNESQFDLVTLSQQQLVQSSVSSVNTRTNACANISRNLGLGQRGLDVKQIQQYLRSTGDYTYPEITGYYGPVTMRAVQSWQRKNGVVSSGTPNTTGYGSVGPQTRRAIYVSCSAQVSTVSTKIPAVIKPNTNISVSMPGITTPINISPIVTNDFFLRTLYKAVLNRDADNDGLSTWAKFLATGGSREEVVGAFLSSAEFVEQKALDVSVYIKRLYQTVLNREPNNTELQSWVESTKKIDDPNASLSWSNTVDGFIDSTEFKNKQCASSYYTYVEPLKSNSPTLNDFFDGTARFQTLEESEIVTLNFSSDPNARIWDEKLPTFKDDASGAYYAFARLYSPSPSDGSESYVIYLLKSLDGGLTFNEVGPLFPENSQDAFYDPQLVINNNACPAEYILTFECSRGDREHVSTCVSRSTDPTNIDSWTKPIDLVTGCDTDKSSGCTSSSYLSASTPAVLIDNDGKIFVSFSVVDDYTAQGDQGVDRVYSVARELQTLDTWAGYADTGTIVLDAEANTNCTNAWDCNNRDIQDWKKEGDWYYLLYNGANYRGCARPAGDDGTNEWGIAITRSKSPLGPYQPAPTPIITADRDDICGVSYGVINNLDGELYLYYANHYANPDANPSPGISVGNYTKRSKLVWESISTPDSTPPPTCTLSASPSSVEYGGSTILSWDGTNVTSASIDNGIGSVSVDGTYSVSNLRLNKNYIVTVNGEGGSSTCSTTVSVEQQPDSTPPPTCTLSSSPSSIVSGNIATLSWVSSNAASASINQGIGDVVVNGSRDVLPDSTRTYTLAVNGPGGTATCGKNITVTAPVMTSNEQIVNDLYKCALGRDADTAGLTYWSDVLTADSNAPDNLFRGILNSDEYVQRSDSNEEYVTKLYECVLGRGSDSAGYAVNLSALDTITRPQLLESFLTSEEFQNKYSGISSSNTSTLQNQMASVFEAFSSLLQGILKGLK